MTVTGRGKMRHRKLWTHLKTFNSKAESKVGRNIENKDERLILDVVESVRGFVLLSLVYRKSF